MLHDDDSNDDWSSCAMDGVRTEVRMHLNGKMHGAWKFFRRDGSLMRSGSFDRGRQVGVWRTYKRSGDIAKETKFPKGDD